MNREEASFILANIDRRVCDDELNEALDMAIKALDQEPCGDAIDRAKAIKVASGYCHPANVAKELAKMPPVTPQPKTGHWIKTPHGFKCSRCLIVHSRPSIFCPSCGAKMIEPQKRSDKE